MGTENLVSKSLAANAPGMDKRRTTRVVQAIPIKVHGVDALSEPFTERTSTVMVSCHGCKYQSRHYVPKGSVVTVEIPRYDPDAPPRTVTGKVIWVQRPSQAREILHIGLEFEVPGSVWDLPSPPSDWFPLPGETLFAIEAEEEAPAVPAVVPGKRVEIVTWDESEISAMSPAAEEEATAAPDRESVTIAEDAGDFLATSVEAEDARMRPALGRQTITGAVAAEAIAEGMRVIRQRLDAQFHDAIEEALTVSIERLSESAVHKIVQQAAKRSFEIADEARKAYEAYEAQLETALGEKIQKAVEEAVNKASASRHGKSKRRK